MDGFTLIPKRNKTNADINSVSLVDAAPEYKEQEKQTYNPNKIMENVGNINLAIDNNGLPIDLSEKVVTEKDVKSSSSMLDGGLLLFVSILLFLGALVYSGYLVFLRQIYVAQIEDYSFKIKSLESKINRSEIEDFKNMDEILKSLRGRIDKHILSNQVFAFINQNMRTTLQVTEYKVDPEPEGGVAVSFSCIVPNFKDMAEQTEKMVELQKSKLIKRFNISNLSLEQDSSKVRFTLRVVFDTKQLTTK